MKYIEAEKIVAEIERWRDKAKEKYNEGAYYMGRCDALAEFRNHIVSLQQEQPEIDLEEEMVSYYNKHFSPCENGVLFSEESGRELDCNDYESIVRHFYEFGLNARKED